MKSGRFYNNYKLIFFIRIIVPVLVSIDNTGIFISIYNAIYGHTNTSLLTIYYDIKKCPFIWQHSCKLVDQKLFNKKFNGSIGKKNTK